MMKSFVIALTSLSLTFCLMACDKGGADKTKNVETTTNKKPSEAMTAVVLSSSDQMKYDKSEITVPGGKKIKLTLRHTGKLPKTTMGHNFVLLKQGTDMQKFAAEAIKAKANGYIPVSMKDVVVAHTRIIGGGETDTITFDAPAAGTYDFLCSFPGHNAVMKGKFIVK